jgi:RimJ/RimL family protein N-acetyltransferase
MENKPVYFRQGAKVALRLVLETDIPEYHSYMNDPEVTQFLATHLPISLAQEREWYEKCIDRLLVI